MIETKDLDLPKAIMHIVVSTISLGAPIWLAWLSTRQIGQRFQLAEDYAYKATLGKVYEGYKKEALSFDKEVAFKLFDSALKHLDEPPLRLVDPVAYGSPLHDILNTDAARQFFKNLPDYIKSCTKPSTPRTRKSSAKQSNEDHLDN